MADETEIQDATALTVQAEPALRDKLATALKPVADSRGETLTIAASAPGQVLPAKFYEGASQLKLTEAEWDILKDSAAVPDDEIEIRPDGLIYASHMFYRGALTRIFGPGQWSLIPSSNAQTPRGDSELVYQAWVLVARGCYVGEAVGSARYLMSNPRRNWADALETTRSDAISKICAKTLGIGVNPWNKRFAREWRKKYAVQVWVNVRGQKEKRWRRIDDDPFEGEEKSARKTEVLATQDTPAPTLITASNPHQSPAPTAAAQASDGLAIPTSEPSGAGSPPSNPPTAQPKAPQKSRPPKPSAAAAAAEPLSKEPPKQSTEQMVAENNIRLFMAEARRRKLVVGNDAISAVTFLVDKIGLPFDPAKFTGKTQIEIIRYLLLGQTWRRFTDEILPKLREIQP